VNQFPVYDILKDAALQWPDSPAVYDDHGTLSFSELFFAAGQLRLQLMQLGIRHGMGVGVKAKNSRNFIIGIFAVVGCGAAVMPMSHQLKKAEIDGILEEARLHAILDDMTGTTAMDNIDAEIPMGDDSFRFSFTHISPDEIFASHVNMPAFIRFTSGTTGKSKGVIISHQAVIERIEGANKGLALGPGDTVIWVLPMAYHFVVSIVLYVRFGAAIAIAKDFLAKNIIDITNQHRGTMLYASPIQIRLLANDTGTDNMPTLKKAISTSAAISLDVCKAFKKRFGLDVSQAYGIIEIGLPMINFVKSAEHPDAVGYALPDYTVDILDDDHNPLPTGQVGHLAIKGPGMFDAYLLPPTLKKDILQNGYFLTADYASKAADGLIKVEGRSKSVINVSGIKIFPEEVEAVLETIPGIRLARISSRPHPLMGQIIEGELLLNEGETVDLEEVLTYCRKRLSNFKAPQHLTIVDSLPMTGSGKLLRH
jgi:acyl-CoA synthetase (AMP-forming)/AMP-acid ligase II